MRPKFGCSLKTKITYLFLIIPRRITLTSFFLDQTEIKQKELVDVLVKYIIYNDKTVFPKEELFNFCSKRFSNIVSEDL